jgi:phospholipid-transporting ATPase
MNVVIACRVSPKQKGSIVKMVKEYQKGKTTLAIGDGANDVGMIMEADIGVGIAGHEGMQAARASDFSFGQFKELKPLLFIHGRECYRRNSDLVCWTFYKNMLYLVAQIWFGFNSAFSGQPLYEPFIFQAYNTILTAFSIMFYALFDYEFVKSELMTKPEHYSIGLTNEKFTNSRFTKWMALGWAQALLIYLVVYYSTQSSTNGNGNSSPGEYSYNLWAAGQNVYATCVILVNVTILQMQHGVTWWNEWLVSAQIFAYFAMIVIMQDMDIFW